MTLITSASAQPEPSESAGGGRVTPSLDAEGYPAFRDYPVSAVAVTAAAPAPPDLMLAGQGEQLTGDDAPTAAPSTSPSSAGGPASRSAATSIARGEEHAVASRQSASPPAETPPDSASSPAPRAADASPSAEPKPAGSTSPSTVGRSDDSPREAADPPAEPSAPAPAEPSAPEPAEPAAPEPAAPEPADPPRAPSDLMDHLAALVAAWGERPSSPLGREAPWDEAVLAGLWWAVVEACDEDHPDRMADCLDVADEIVAEMELSPVEPTRWTQLVAEGRDAGYRLALDAMGRLEARPDPEPDAPAELPELPSRPLLPLP